MVVYKVHLERRIILSKHKYRLNILKTVLWSLIALVVGFHFDISINEDHGIISVPTLDRYLLFVHAEKQDIYRLKGTKEYKNSKSTNDTSDRILKKDDIDQTLTLNKKSESSILVSRHGKRKRANHRKRNRRHKIVKKNGGRRHKKNANRKKQMTGWKGGKGGKKNERLKSGKGKSGKGLKPPTSSGKSWKATTFFPTKSPTLFPTQFPTFYPTQHPTFSDEIFFPTTNPTVNPTLSPTFSPSLSPTISPTLSPSFSPTMSPTMSPTFSPTASPTFSENIAVEPNLAMEMFGIPVMNGVEVKKFEKATANYVEYFYNEKNSNRAIYDVVASIEVTDQNVPRGNSENDPSHSIFRMRLDYRTIDPDIDPFILTIAPFERKSSRDEYVKKFLQTKGFLKNLDRVSRVRRADFIPTLSPTISPTFSPTLNPTFSPTFSPSFSPTLSPSFSPTISPTLSPTVSPTLSPTLTPTLSPTMSPTLSPTFSPTMSPSLSPTVSPTAAPTKKGE